MISIIVIVLFTSAASAEGWNAFGEFTYRQLQYLSERAYSANTTRELPGGRKVGASFETRGGTHKDLDIRTNSGSLTYHAEREDHWWFDAAAGNSTITNSYRWGVVDSKQIFLASLSGGRQFHAQWNVQYRLGQEFLYAGFVDPPMARERLSEKLAEITFDGYPGPFNVKATYRRTWLSDGNRRGGVEGHALYAITDDVRVGLGLWGIAFDQRRANYWTPAQLNDVQIRTEFGFQPKEGWSMKGKLYVGRTFEPRKRTGNTSMQEVRLERTLQSCTVGVFYTRYNAAGEGFDWWRQDTGLNVSGSF